MQDHDSPTLRVGKLPPEMLARLLAAAPVNDPRVLVGTGGRNQREANLTDSDIPDGYD